MFGDVYRQLEFGRSEQPQPFVHRQSSHLQRPRPGPGVVHGYHVPHPGLGFGGIESHHFFVFLEGKKDLVARAVVIQPHSHGGFGVISAHLKSRALLLRSGLGVFGCHLVSPIGLNPFFVPLPQKSSLFLFVLILNISLRFMLPFWMLGVLWMATHLRTSPIYLLEAPQPLSRYRKFHASRVTIFC